FLCALFGVFVKSLVWGWRKQRKTAGNEGAMSPSQKVGTLERLERWWHLWENKFVTVTSGAALLTFLFTAIFVAPYHRYKKEHDRANKAENTVLEKSNDLRITRADLKASEDARLKRLENFSGGADISMFDQLRSMLREINPGIVTEI